MAPNLCLSFVKVFPVAAAVCVGALFYYRRISTGGKILRWWLPSNKNLTVPPQEERSEERSEERPGAERRGNTPTGAAAVWSQLEPAGQGEEPARSPDSTGDDRSVNQLIWGQCFFIKDQQFQKSPRSSLATIN